MIDIEKIKDYTGGDEEFIAMLFDKFLSRMHDDLSTLEAAAAAEDWKAVRSRTHAMLSSARIFFWDEIIELSIRIEADCEALRTEQIQSSTQQLIKLYQEVEHKIHDWKQSVQ